MAQRIFDIGTRVRIHAGRNGDKFGTVIAPIFDGSNTVQWDDTTWNPHPVPYFMGEVKQAWDKEHINAGE